MSVSVGACLEALLGSEAVTSVTNGCALLNAFTCVLHVVVLNENANREGLLEAFTKGARYTSAALSVFCRLQ